MATNVLELHRFDRSADLRPLIEQVTIRERSAILPAAMSLARAVQRIGLSIMIWDDLSRLAPMVDAGGHPLNRAVFGWDDATLAAFEGREAALRNPALRACRMESEPFLINAAGVHGIGADCDLAPVPAGDTSEGTGLPAVIGVPVHMAFGQIGAAILAAGDPATDMAEAFARLPAELAAAIRRFVSSYVAVTRDARYLPPPCLLSQREIECLSWVAQGKTDFEISIILGCSHAGVRYHITRACERLGAVNRAQSVFRASQLGYIGPGAP